ncbi:methylmalonyl Co-A mutase-associated GTPase MeaB [Williamwhitmania taraxaci]|uniref:Methylmalonyl-CoA mutase metallochaperone MeaB n=1 Tax=Williamwhitmania taraxaci TaxID=1640674 RepID=A0A1G6QJZ1_9BACT|nr:methylmalonyl Co-A mutase-associated GTPase MeaB [Williamwhitmania taraxaci]SDC92511.1 methylmalonyl-CoA mutase metallochaperone MeaB [Williamwhitmania taraxaci]
MEERNKSKSALTVNSGIPQPPQVNPNALTHIRKNKKDKLSVSDYVEGILSGNISILSQGITLIESSLPKHHIIAQQVIEQCLPHAGKSVRVGITGVPGVGKSTFIEALGVQITSQGKKLAVLAIDPSSERSKGSILGDKTRMEVLSVDPNAYIRPSPSAGSLGGVARKTRESIVLCEAAGFDVVFIETVGVGQSETAVHSMVDCFLLLMLAGAGDELQGIKRGIMEMADLLAITKADGANLQKAMMAKAEYTSALHLYPPAESGWDPRVLTCSSLEKDGIADVWNTISDYIATTKENEFFQNKRQHQSKYWMFETINESLRESFYDNVAIQNLLTKLEEDVLSNKLTSFAAAQMLLDKYFDNLKE